ncbi:hypothetical protein [uncultured Nostoc sp.]|uniref:hypothetical protein n=1 Tax=uncultured Nostoc sp. TaxID=340711 RepID=UPI0035CC6411
MPTKIIIREYQILDVRCESRGLKVHNLGRDDWFIYVASVGQDEGLAKYHLHVFFNKTIPPTEIVKVLPKSGNWRDGNEPDLAKVLYDQWVAEVRDTDSRTREVTEIFLKLLRDLNYVQE